MTSLIVYTTVFGPTKPLHEPVAASGARFICFTDQLIASDRWEIVRVPPTPTPARECRRLKQLSHIVFPAARSTLWTDSSFSLKVDPVDLLESHPYPMTTFRHPHRKRISDEAKVIVSHGKGKPDAIAAQLAAYQAEGFDSEDNPQRVISAGGFVLRRHTEAVKRFNEIWFHEVQTRSLRDQMSIDYSAWKAGLRIHHFPGTYLDNELADLTRYKRATIDF